MDEAKNAHGLLCQNEPYFYKIYSVLIEEKGTMSASKLKSCLAVFQTTSSDENLNQKSSNDIQAYS